jgi:hypothetical protein
MMIMMSFIRPSFTAVNKTSYTDDGTQDVLQLSKYVNGSKDALLYRYPDGWFNSFHCGRRKIRQNLITAQF